MSKEFKMSIMGELTFFLGLQIKQSKDGIFINQAKYTKELLKRFDMEASNAFDTPMSSSLKLDKDEKGKDVDIKRYRDFKLVLRNLIWLPSRESLDILRALTI
ncbi:hypothetical protein RJ640_027545 [Escallonia rubra]|uniref:Reverse transcriptase Ty1/copia-type domain-containing protein n=1 Tax=Escallonia rubra TaxID=112253 RepID=A0AA88QSG5_9ASTE|nr:hypothetical protein RJ640_027545 [Escallonia rubra]